MADTLPIQFVHEDATQVLAECKAWYEDKLGREIAPADIEMLLINGLAYREMVIRSGLNEAARQNMVSFSRGNALEYLGELVGVSRLPATGATCTIEFALVSGHNGVTIPEGLRVQSLDGKVIFQTAAAKVCVIGTTTAQIYCTASEPGAIGNGYAIGKIAIILDPVAFLATATNIDVTAGGADEESDEKLRDRIKLAPASFSVAGPDDAYKFFAKSAHPSIVDVAITSPNPGEVHIFPLMEGGEMPSTEIIDAVQARCNSKKIRPLTDTVVTAAPSTTTYLIEVNLTLLDTAVGSGAETEVQNILDAYVASRQNRLGLDVVREKISALGMIDSVYKCVVVSPATNIVANPDVFTKCTGVTVNIVGTHDE